MLGFEVFVYREKELKKKKRAKGQFLARWQTSVFGLQWIKALVKEGKVVDLGGDGYPTRYTTTAEIFFPLIAAGLPDNESPITIGDDYVLPAGRSGALELNHKAISKCPSGEVLVIEAWDQS